MKPRTLALSVLLSVAAFGTAPFALAEAAPKLAPMFNEKDLTGWKAEDSKEFWHFDQGVLVGENNAAKKGNYLWTQKEYSDFVMEFDVRWTGEIDSGVEFRKPLQLQIGVSRSLKKDMTGSFYVGKTGYPESGQAKEALKLLKPDGQWNTFRLEVKGSNYKVWINGTKASDYTDTNFKGPAPIGLQIHAGLAMKVEYRNVKLAEW